MTTVVIIAGWCVKNHIFDTPSCNKNIQTLKKNEVGMKYHKEKW